MAQTWDDLLFAHWPLAPEAVAPFLPPGLELDTRDGRAWLGVTPFAITGLRPRGLLPLPVVSQFLELNVRTYVRRDGKPGIWFFSLDASSRAAVAAARAVYRLPYFHAQIARSRAAEGWRYECVRRGGGRGPQFAASYAPVGPPAPAREGSLEHYLTERYCLYTTGAGGRIRRAEIHHRPWPLQPAEATIERNTMPPAGLEPGAAEPLLHFSKRQDVLVWPLSDA